MIHCFSNRIRTLSHSLYNNTITLKFKAFFYWSGHCLSKETVRVDCVCVYNNRLENIVTNYKIICLSISPIIILLIRNGTQYIYI